MMTTPTNPEAIFRLEGRFDQSAAEELRGRLLQSEAQMALLDFSRVAEFDDATLAHLTANLAALSQRGCKVRLFGLRAHQSKLLDPLGVTLREDGFVTLGSESELPFTD